MSVSNRVKDSGISYHLLNFTQAALGNMLVKFPYLTRLANYEKDSLRIVYYHLISDQQPEYYFDNKTISPKVFKEHLAFFKKRYDIISLNEALKLVEEKQSLYKKLVLTFDDGFAENYRIIAPILKDQKLPATFFLIANCIDNQDLMWRNKLVVIQKRTGNKFHYLVSDATRTFHLPERRRGESVLNWSGRAWKMYQKEAIVNFLWNAGDIGTIGEYLQEKKPYLTSGEINCLLREGFHIGTHSMSHPIFSKLSYREFEEELLTSTKFLQSRFNTEINSFSYPFGIKAKPEFEQRLLNNNSIKIKTFLGTKNKFNNNMNCLSWERDNLEFPTNKMMFRFTILPLLRGRWSANL
jgi:peptidoglycan/xylan/chitin deacetylase (PgdA/CDA1 family)